MTFRAFVLVGLVLLASAADASFVRDIDGKWTSLRSNKRSVAGDVLRLPLTNNNDQSYSVAVRMGTPFQQIQMAVSLSQNYIVVASPSSTSQSGFFNPTSSSTYISGMASAPVTGLDGNQTIARFAGESCQVLDFGYNASLGITPPNTPNLYPDGCTGVLGYGIDQSQVAPKDSGLLNDYIPMSLITSGGKAVCGIQLNRASDGGPGGTFTMGGLDNTAFTGDFTTMQVPAATSVQRPSWSVPLDSVRFKTPSSSQFSIPGGIASIDPYYPTIGLRSSDVATLYSNIAGAVVSPTNPSRYTVPCNAVIHITMTFGGKEFALDPRDAISNQGGVCFGTVEVSPSNVMRVGSPFMRNVYTTFAAQFNTTPATLTVGFAKRAGNSATATARSGLSTGKVVAIAVSTFVVGIIFAVALLCLLRRRIARFIRGPQQPPENAGAPPQTPQTGQMQQPLLNLWGPDFSDVSRTTPQTGMRPSDGQASPPSPSSNPMSQETLQPLHTFVTTTGPVQLGQVSPIHQQQQLLPVRQTPSPHQGSPPPQVLQHLGIPQDGPTFQGGPFAQSSPFAQSGPPTQSAPIQGSHAGPYPGPYQGPHPGQAWTNPQAPIDAGGQNMAPLSSSSPPRSAQSPPPPFSPAPGYSFVG